MKTKDKIIQSLQDALSKLNIEKTINISESTNYGDFSTNLALTLTKDLQKSPMEIAQLLVGNIDNEKYDIKKVEIAAPGFLNFFMEDNILALEIQNILDQNNEYGSDKQNQKINVEFVSANPTGFLHVAHARGAVLGSVLSNVLQFTGNDVTREYYINDAGNQIDRLGISAFIRYLQALKQPVELPEDSYKGQDIVWLGQKLKDLWGNKYQNSSYEEVKDIFKSESVRILLERIKEDLKLLNVELDVYTSELSIYENNAIENVLKKLKGLYQKDGATWLRTTEYGDDKDRVLIKNDGSNTYLLPDIAYHDQKFLSNGKQDKLINIWGADHIGYIKRMEVALKQLGYEPEKQLKTLVCQTVRLMKNGEEFKMSKRKGTTISLRELVELVGSDAVRFFIIDRSENSGIDFDMDLTLERNASNPVFLVQYTHARATQLLLKASNEEIKPVNFENENEIKLINNLKLFPELVKNISQNYKVHLLPQYLIKLSKDFNSFYSNSDKIIGHKNQSSLLALVKATKIVLANGLKLIGVSAPEIM